MREPPILLHVETELVGAERFVRELYWYDPSARDDGSAYVLDPSTHVAWAPVTQAISASELSFRQRHGTAIRDIAVVMAQRLSGRHVLSLSAACDRRLLGAVCEFSGVAADFAVEPLDE